MKQNWVKFSTDPVNFSSDRVICTTDPVNCSSDPVNCSSEPGTSFTDLVDYSTDPVNKCRIRVLQIRENSNSTRKLEKSRVPLYGRESVFIRSS